MDTVERIDPPEALIELSSSGLRPLTEGHYGLWATFFEFSRSGHGDGPLHDDGFVLLGKFTVATDGSLVSLDGQPMRFRIPAGIDPQLLDDIVVTVETVVPEPGGTVERGASLLGGKFTGDSQTAVADLRMGYRDALGNDFSTLTGAYTLIAPTSPPDSNSGVWFLERGSPAVPSLRNLPVMRTGWTYEGWVVRRSAGAVVEYISTGKFVRADSADFDGAGAWKGTGVGLQFPGQDFITYSPRPNLRSPEFSFMVTLEPVQDNSPEPFFVRLLESAGQPTQSAGILVNVIRDHAPIGRVTVRR